ncbi:MAG TPA: hypothetical protein VN408_13480 [Actinoplanes sp.]|nr:hypothetical protein [Actinoplanes sp.]
MTSTKVPVLRIYCTTSWPNLITACETAMLDVLARRVHRVSRQGCTAVQSYSNHWPCLLPQHGPGPKHKRPITLTDWQQEITGIHTEDFLRGLIHSDGCRTTNRIVRTKKTYEYPRYHFSNESTDIMGLRQKPLDRLGVAWTMCKPNLLSVAQRAAVTRLDEFIGPKS